VAVAVVGGEHGLEVERLALMRLPDLSRHDYEAGRRVAEAAVQHRSVAVEIKQEGSDLFLKSIQIERVARRDDASDLLGGGAK
jgi:hypothetical protein